MKQSPIDPGTTRVTTYCYPVSGTTNSVEIKSAPRAMTIWNTGMYIAGKLAKTFGGFVLDGVNAAFDAIDKEAGASVHTFQSFRYFQKNAQVYTASGSWSTRYQAEREETYKHAFNSWRSTKYNTTRTKTIDYVPENGFSAHKIVNSPNYSNNTELDNRAWTNCTKVTNIIVVQNIIKK
ncbi:hypothetical protein [Bacillus sp. AFS088145]|uniref:hypothetical protein n=1 Tax=Bacillus sp. AFS088145 TaxID=2033514 RepID=UPI000BFA1F0C|nr:hypothetical protein [Bacillus sp. AFS088145]PFH82557.1 hypothetical protein COI44_19635 [Bacillus sp. AFS088145]